MPYGICIPSTYHIIMAHMLLSDNYIANDVIHVSYIVVISLAAFKQKCFAYTNIL